LSAVRRSIATANVRVRYYCDRRTCDSRFSKGLFYFARESGHRTIKYVIIIIICVPVCHCACNVLENKSFSSSIYARAPNSPFDNIIITFLFSDKSDCRVRCIVHYIYMCTKYDSRLLLYSRVSIITDITFFIRATPV